MAIVPLQQDYKTVFDQFILGMVPDMRSPARDFSRTVQDAAGIAFGSPVGQGTEDHQCRPIATGLATKYLGFAVRDKTTTVEGRYKQYQEVRIRNEGPLVVSPSVAVAAGDIAYIVPATGAITNVEAGNTRVGQFEMSGAAGSLVVVNLR